MPPTAATGLAFTSDDPVATAAVSDVELVIIPQPRSTSALPVAVIPVADVLSRLITQYLPDGTIVAVADAAGRPDWRGTYDAQAEALEATCPSFGRQLDRAAGFLKPGQIIALQLRPD